LSDPDAVRETLFICEPGWEAALVDELRRMLGADVDLRPDRATVRVAARFEDCEPCVAFARQALPDVAVCRAESIALWSEAACERIVEGLDAVDVPWRLHVFGLPRDDGTTLGRRTQLIAERIDADLRERRRRLAKRRNADAEGPWLDGEVLVQIALASPTDGYVSICDAATRERWRRVVSRFVGGSIEPASDKEAPSRAFAKLVEVERRMNRPIATGETCVDLGAAPGSWTYTALARGATVTAVDRSPLRDDLMRDPRLTFVRGDAFRYRPEQPVDWLLSDVIAFPDRVLELLDAWLGAGLCRRLCVTIKFRGRDDDAALETIKQRLASSDYEFCVRRLNANKNEATAYGVRRDADDGDACGV
jgi:23S rRNA (cytidine2498-2'-O)-methyltransferase